MLGILGGMGPLATADFYRKVIQNTVADRDQGHIPIAIWSVPQIPDRTEAILGHGPSPLPEMVRGVQKLQAMGAASIAIPCNTAHHWYDELIAATPLPILHIGRAAAEEIGHRAPWARSVGLLATEGTARAEVYEQFLAPRYRVISPSGDERVDLSAAISLIKAGKVLLARPLLAGVLAMMRARGTDAILLACTELPLAAPADPDLVDATEALAKACVRWFSAAPEPTSRRSAS